MEENVGGYFYNIGIKNTFLNMTWNPETTKEKTDRFNSVKNKNREKRKS